MKNYKAYIIIGGLEYQLASIEDEDGLFSKQDVKESIEALNKGNIRYLETQDGNFISVPDGTEYHVVFRKVS